jgi:hypothetical protein
MTQFLKLPSGQFFNVETIVSTAEKLQTQPQGPEHDSFTVYTTVVKPHGNNAVFYGPDARALYAWLDAHAVAIGEDGREVAPSSELDSGKLSILKALAIKEPARMGDFCNAADDEQCEALTQLTHDGYIERINLEGSRVGIYTLTNIGRTALFESE